MLAYVLVVETPYFVKTSNDGAARFTDLLAGDYELKAWQSMIASSTTSLSAIARPPNTMM